MAYDPRDFGARCHECWLYSRREGGPVPAEVGDGARMVVVGEAPGRDEVELGRPFIGESWNRVLGPGLGAVGIRRRDLVITNSLMCRPPANELAKVHYQIRRENARRKKLNRSVPPGEEPWAIIPTPEECCRPRLLSELQAFGVASVDVLALGGTALKSVTETDKSITEMRGGPIEGWLSAAGFVNKELGDLARTGDDRPVRVMPTFHPALILRQRKWTGVFRADLGRAVRWFSDRLGWKDPEILIRPTPAQVHGLLSRPERFFAWDLETDKKEPLIAKLRCFGVGTAERVQVIPFLSIDGVTKFYTQADERDLIQILSRFLENHAILKVGWNSGLYDKAVMRSRWGVVVRRNLDGIMLHRSSDPEMPHGLGFAGSTLTDVTAWKSDHTGVHAKTDSDLWLYNGIDVAVTARVIPPLEESITLRHQWDVVAKEHKVQSICYGLHRNGMLVDAAVRNELDRKYLEQIVKYRKVCRDVVGRDDFNPNSVPQVSELLFERWGLPPIALSEETGAPSTGDETLRAYLTKYNLTAEQKAFIDALRRTRIAVKFRGTNVVKFRRLDESIPDDGLWEDIDETEEEREYRRKKDGKKMGILLPDGRVHSTWNPHVATTLRLTSSDPAMQNWSRKLRHMIVAAPGNILVGADSDQLELRYAAAHWRMERMLAIFRDPTRDPHAETAFDVFGEAARKMYAEAVAWAAAGLDDKGKPRKAKNHKGWGRVRDFSKRLRYACQYGAEDETVYDVISSVEDDDMNLIYADVSLEDCRNRRRALLDADPEYEIAWDREVGIWRRQGFQTDRIWGHRIDHLDGEDFNAIVNFPIQCIPGFVRVLTDRGYVPIAELQGVSFKAWTGKDWAPASVIPKGAEPMQLVRTDRGVSLFCDAAHSLLAVEKTGYSWRKASDLTLNGRVALDMARPLEFGTPADAEDAYHIGFWLAEGSATASTEEDVTLSFANNDRARLARVERWARARGLRVSRDDSRKCGKRVIHVGGVAWLRSWGADPNWRSDTKRVPERIWRSDLASRRAFFRGFLDGDGYIVEGSVGINLCQRELLEELWLLARTVGVDGGAIRGPYVVDKKGHIGYHARFSADMVFEATGFGRRAKRRTRELAPWWEAKRVLGGLDPTCQSDAVIRSRLAHGKETTSPYVLQRMGADDIYDHARITSVGARRVVLPVYTLTVDDPEHRYVAQGFISKNCGSACLIHDATFEVLEEIPFEKWGPGTGLIHQGHDALVVECPEAEAEKVAKTLVRCMTRRYPGLDVEFKAEAKIGHRWSEC